MTLLCFAVQDVSYYAGLVIYIKYFIIQTSVLAQVGKLHTRMKNISTTFIFGEFNLHGSIGQSAASPHIPPFSKSH
jgi:hypothetical protein